MSASLVGSEMCIRDSSLTRSPTNPVTSSLACSLVHALSLAPSLVPQGEGAQQDRHERKAKGGLLRPPTQRDGSSEVERNDAK
eukprot:14312422-Alexandrium_andersonii.AAC.1